MSKSTISYKDILRDFIDWLYQKDDYEVPEIFMQLPINTLLTILHRYDAVLPILKDLNDKTKISLINKKELMMFLKWLVKLYCIPIDKIAPLYSIYKEKNEYGLKDYEIEILKRHGYLFEKDKIVERTKLDTMSISEIRERFRNIKNNRPQCKECGLYNCEQVLFDSNIEEIRRIEVLFVGEAPGEDEVKSHQDPVYRLPFVGIAGRKLRQLLKTHLDKSISWFITNTCLCRPPSNRAPTPSEIQCCESLLEFVLDNTNPRLIVALGSTAKNRFNIEEGVTKIKDQIYDYKSSNGNIYKVLVTVHPSYVVRTNQDELLIHTLRKINQILRPSQNISNVSTDNLKLMPSIKLPQEAYELDLVDIQSLQNGTILYIFLKDGRRKYIKSNQEGYYYFSDNPLGPYIEKLENVHIVDWRHPSQGTITYETFPILVRHTVDYFFNRSNPNQYKPRVCYLDIEIATSNKEFPDPKRAEWPISCITMNYGETKICYVLSSKRLPERIGDTIIETFRSERSLIENVIKIFHSGDFDIITAWNIVFDLGYLINRMSRIGIDLKRLSPIRQMPVLDIDKYLVNIPGLVVLDLLTLYRSITYGSKESYSLDYISRIELGESKIAKGREFTDLFENDIISAISYNIDDVEKIRKIDEKLGIIKYYNELRNASHTTWKDVTSTHRLIENKLAVYCKHNNLVLRDHISSGDDNSDIPKIGAYVRQPTYGFNTNVIVADFASLYPSIMTTLNISIDTYVARLKDYWKDFGDYISGIDREYILIESPLYEKKEMILSRPQLEHYLRDKIITPIGTIFCNHNEKLGIVGQLLMELYEKRKEFKELMEKDPDNKEEYDNKQRAVKELMNSHYGYFGFDGSRMYSKDIVNSITLTGQTLTKLSTMLVENYFNKSEVNISEMLSKIVKDYFLNSNFESIDIPSEYVVYSDTDSIYIRGNFESIDQAKKQSKEILDYINDYIRNQLLEIFGVDKERCMIKLNFETVCKKVFWTGVKKRYAYRDENDKIVIKGIETNRSDYPRYTREKLSELLDLLLKEDVSVDNITSMIKEVYHEFRHRAEDLDITVCKPVSFSTNSYKKVPSHVVGMLLWNRMVNREDFKPGSKGYLFNIRIVETTDKIKDIVTDLRNQTGLKGDIHYLAVPEDVNTNDIKWVFENFKGIEIDIDSMVDFGWVKRCESLIGDMINIDETLDIRKKSTRSNTCRTKNSNSKQSPNTENKRERRKERIEELLIFDFEI